MSGPYLNGLGRRKRTHYKSSSSKDENTDIFLSDDRRMKKSYNKKLYVTTRDAEVIPKFRPEDSDSDVISWLHKIDQLGSIYGWDHTDRIFIMQMRLRGSARDWYDDLENYDLTWDGWKEMLRTAFPQPTDYVDKLERMLARTKEEKETMSKYYFEKLSLLKKCNITGEDAVSCIIQGLPAELIANAKAYPCDTPEQLYHGCLSYLENFKRVPTYAVRRSTWRRGAKTMATHQLQPKVCYICQRPGHVARNCWQQQCCDCRRIRHTTAAC